MKCKSLDQVMISSLKYALFSNWSFTNSLAYGHHTDTLLIVTWTSYIVIITSTSDHYQGTFPGGIMIPKLEVDVLNKIIKETTVININHLQVSTKKAQCVIFYSI